MTKDKLATSKKEYTLLSDSNGKQVCSGIYFFQIKAGNNTEVIKMILLK